MPSTYLSPAANWYATNSGQTCAVLIYLVAGSCGLVKGEIVNLFARHVDCSQMLAALPYCATEREYSVPLGVIGPCAYHAVAMLHFDTRLAA